MKKNKEEEQTSVIELPKIHGKEIPYLAGTDAFVLKTDTNGTESIKGVTLSEKLAKKMISDNDFYGVSSYEQVHVYTEELETTQSQPFNSEEFTKIIAEHAQKTAQVNHDLEMKRIKAKMIADITLEIVRQKPESIVFSNPAETAKLIADEAFKDIE